VSFQLPQLGTSCFEGQPVWVGVIAFIALIYLAFCAGCSAGLVWDLLSDEDTPGSGGRFWRSGPRTPRPLPGRPLHMRRLVG